MRFYWDVYLVLNFIMNLFLIGMTALLRRKYLKKGCLVVAAFLGSSQETLVVLLWLRYCVGKAGGMQKMYQPGVFLLVVALLTALEMLQITFHEKQLRELLKDIFAMLQVSLVTGGMIYVCREWICRWRSPGIWMVFAGAAGVFLVLFVMERYLRHGEKRVNTMDGIIGLEDGRRYPLRLLLDTGNCLVSPYSGERVMIMAQSLALKLKIAEQKRPAHDPVSFDRGRWRASGIPYSAADPAGRFCNQKLPCGGQPAIVRRFCRSAYYVWKKVNRKDEEMIKISMPNKFQLRIMPELRGMVSPPKGGRDPLYRRGGDPAGTF